jgi:hypothetical protein
MGSADHEDPAPQPAIRAWAEQEAAKLPPFTPAQVRQLARSVRAVDTRLAQADPAGSITPGGHDQPATA